jgi:hypothetical protein
MVAKIQRARNHDPRMGETPLCSRRAASAALACRKTTGDASTKPMSVDVIPGAIIGNAAKTQSHRSHADNGAST